MGTLAVQLPELTGPATLTDKYCDRGGSTRDQTDAGESTGSILLGDGRHNTILTIAAASVAPILYVLFVYRYATDSFFGDDWSTALLVHAALHGHLSLGLLWSQYNETRLVLGNMVDVVFGYINRFDLRSVMLFTAVVFIASYAVLLALVHSYIGRRLTPIPVFILGTIWFSLADVQNALWAFQVSWYLTVFFFMVMLFALLIPANSRRWWLGLAVFAAMAGSLSTVQGFILWPVGAVCILWNQPVRRRHDSNQPSTRTTRFEAALWIGAAILTIALYLPGYSFNEDGCIPASACSSTSGLHHPFETLRYFLVLIGNVVPGGFITGHAQSVIRFELVGVALFITAAFILVQSWRYRATRENRPLPLLLITFSLVFDLSISLSRSGIGPAGAISSNRYVMPNLILLAGITIYAWARLPKCLQAATGHSWQIHSARIALAALAIFIIAQATIATGFGLANGRATSTALNTSARFFVNRERAPVHARVCEAYLLLWSQPGAIPSFAMRLHDAGEDQLGEFEPGAYREYRQQGLPMLFPVCLK